MGNRPTRRRAADWIAAGLGLLGLILFALGLSPRPASAQAPEGFVVADGASFGIVSSGAVSSWRPVGYNQYRLTSAPGGYVCDSGYGELSSAKLAAWLDQIRAAGATVVRTWFFQSQFDPDGTGSGQGSFAAFDRVVQGAAARGMKVVPVLANHWADCEFGGSAKTAEFYESGFRAPGYGYELSYADYARTVAANYAGEPAIAFWQLVNEAEAPSVGGGCDEGRAAAALRGFAAEMAGLVKEVDPNHLVSLGTMGSGQCGSANGHYRSIHEGVDICEFHDYDYEGNPADDSSNPLPGDAWNGLPVRLDQCGRTGLNKPLLVGEAGIRADVGGRLDYASLDQRAAYFESKIAAQFDAGVDGFLLWEKVLEPSDSPTVAGGHEAYGVGFGDPTEDVTRHFGEAWDGTAAPWVEPRPLRNCKPRGKGRRGSRGCRQRPWWRHR